MTSPYCRSSVTRILKLSLISMSSFHQRWPWNLFSSSAYKRKWRNNKLCLFIFLWFVSCYIFLRWSTVDFKCTVLILHRYLLSMIWLHKVEFLNGQEVQPPGTKHCFSSFSLTTKCHDGWKFVNSVFWLFSLSRLQPLVTISLGDTVTIWQNVEW